MNHSIAITTNHRQQSQRSIYFPTLLVARWTTMQHYATILCALALMVSLNLSLLIWLLSQLNFAIENDSHLSSKASNDHLHLIGSVKINGQLAVQNLASPKDLSELRIQTDDLVLRPHHWSSSIVSFMQLNADSMQANVGDMIAVRSSHNDRLLLLIDRQTPDSSKLFVDQVVIRSTPTLQNRALSFKNGSAQVLQLQSVDHSTMSSLTLTSYTNRIRLRGTRHLRINSSKQSIQIDSRKQALSLHSGHGRIMINTKWIHLEPQSIRTVVATKLGRTYLTVGQLCLCANNGRLFMAPAEQQNYPHPHSHQQHSWMGHLYHQQEQQRCQRLASTHCWTSSWTQST
uniref:Zeta-sarcoglycan-like n=1 Tax=Dermatophagoides pteronyssinus TaxID=6956 RepID=A0A6P6XSW1_DERPT|nr:zeta-sarcoglycan-like [Dermatophagoides pteronyssinus]